MSVATTFIIVAHPFSAPRPDGRLRVDFLDVGQGDAALLTMPDGTTLLVDGGGRPDFGSPAPDGADFGAARFERDARAIGDAVVSEFLWSRGLDRIDYLLATHAHADHIDGLKDVARNFRVRAALVARTPPASAEYAAFSAAMRASNIPVRLVARGDALRFGAATAEVLYPPPAPVSSPGEGAADAGALPSGNDDSVVLRVRYGSRCFLLTGDAERGAETALVAAGDDLRCDMVKIGHHGSRTSSTAPFVAATRPAFAVVSVGLTSPFGHPDAAVVERWRAAGAQVLQTGRRGTITFTTDGQDLRVETFARE